MSEEPVLKYFTNDPSYTCKCGLEIENIMLGEIAGKPRYGRRLCECQKPVKAAKKKSFEDPKYPRQNGFMPEEHCDGI